MEGLYVDSLKLMAQIYQTKLRASLFGKQMFLLLHLKLDSSALVREESWKKQKALIELVISLPGQHNLTNLGPFCVFS